MSGDVGFSISDPTASARKRSRSPFPPFDYVFRYFSTSESGTASQHERQIVQS